MFQIKVVFEDMDKLLFGFHGKQELYWSDMNQNETHLTTCNVQPHY